MKILVFLLSVLSFTSLAETTYNGDSNQIAAVEKAVNYYLKGSLLGDPDVIKKAFHPDAKVQGFARGKHSVYDIPTFLGFFSKDKPGKHEINIVSVDIANSAASVRCEWDFGSWKYVDYLSLIKLDNEWKIVSKIYTIVKKDKK